MLPKHLNKFAVIDFFECNEHIFECHVFFIEQWSGQPRETDEMALPDKFSKVQLPIEKMWKANSRFLPLIISGKKIVGEARYDKGMRELLSFTHFSM